MGADKFSSKRQIMVKPLKMISQTDGNNKRQLGKGLRTTIRCAYIVGGRMYVGETGGSCDPLR